MGKSYRGFDWKMGGHERPPVDVFGKIRRITKVVTGRIMCYMLDQREGRWCEFLMKKCRTHL